MYSYKDITKLNQYNTAPVERKEKYCRDWSSYILGLCQVLGKKREILRRLAKNICHSTAPGAREERYYRLVVKRKFLWREINVTGQWL